VIPQNSASYHNRQHHYRSPNELKSAYLGIHSCNHFAMSNQISESESGSGSESIPSELNLPFESIFKWLGIGEPLPSQWQAIANLPLIILVGVTAAGKNTATAAMQKLGIEFALLPNRRELSDRITIPLMMGGEQINQINQKATPSQIQKLDRVERLQYTRQFRQKYPGGMAQVIAKMSIDTSLVDSLIVFDGLRGAAEVGYAALNLPQAKFIVLEAPDLVRLMRLLTRNDPFDRASTNNSNNSTNNAPNQQNASQNKQDLNQKSTSVVTNLDHQTTASEFKAASDRPGLPHSFASLGIPDASLIFAPDQEQEIFQLLQTGQIEVNQLHDKLKIIIAERQNYDPQAARDQLMAIAPERSLFIDTSTTPPRIAHLVSNYA
jgi:hypothetical protein